MEAWTTIGGPKLIQEIRYQNGWSSAKLFGETVGALFLASDLTVMGGENGRPFEIGNAKFICSKLINVDFRNELAKSISNRLYARGRRPDAIDYIAYEHPQRYSTSVSARHPLANLPSLCEIPENDLDLKFSILNHKIGRLIKTTITEYRFGPVQYYVTDSTNFDINEQLSDFATRGIKSWLKGPGGMSGRVRNWYTTVYSKMVDPVTGIFEAGGDGIYRLAVISNLDEINKNVYKGIGMLLASTLVEGYALGVEFNRVFYEVLLHKLDVTKLTGKDLELNDRQYFNSWKYGAECDTEVGVSCEEAIENAFGDTVKVSSDGNRALVETAKKFE